MWLWFLLGLGAVFSAEGAGAGAARLVCYVETARSSDFTECTHLVYAGTARGDKLDGLLKDYRKHNPKLKIVLRVTDEDKDLKDILKSKYIQGVEIYDAHQTFNRTKVSEMVEAARSALSSANKGPLLLALPAHPELLAKYYDLRTLVKKADLMMVQTHALGTVKKMTYHPSRLSGLWDMMNTDSIVDLVIGLGVPASKIVVSLPATARQFTLQNETLSTPGSPALEEEPREIDQADLCRQLQRGRWTLERDQDLSAPYAFKNSTWISFEDSSSVDVKGKYARVRGLAGLALFRADRDADTPCGGSLRSVLHKVLNQQSRAPRAAVLRSLENEILSAGLGGPAGGRALDALQVSPYRITQVVDSDGVIHSIREDTRTEFSCSRQGYFVHPRSCARFYRCVKFDQYSPDFTVFEFDCPAGLAFDARYEVCVWPGALPAARACPGSSEVAPVPAARFLCPKEEGFYVDPENCRWFFACLDHGKSPLTAYEFRCPFGLGFDAARLRCDWPWLVPDCGNIGRYEAEAFGFSAATLTGATGFQGRTADSVNVAAHRSLASGAALDNLVGVQGGFLSAQDALDGNFIAAQDLDQTDYYLGSQGEPSGLSYKVVAADAINKGLVQATNYDDEEKYTSGSIILDDYRLPTNKGAGYVQSAANVAADARAANALRYDSGQYRGNNVPPKFRTGAYRKDNRGAYVHNPAGDRAKPYQHVDVAPVPYQHIDINSKDANNFDRGTYHGSSDRGTYSGSYDTGSYNQDATKSSGYDYPKPNVQFNEGLDTSLYTVDSHGYTSVAGAADAQSTSTYHGSYGSGDVSTYVTDSRVYPGAPHTLTAGAVNVDLVGKTTLLDESNRGYQYSEGVVHQAHDVSQPGVAITHIGTDSQNLDGYGYVTTPTSSGIPTTATPFAVTTSLPVTYKTTYVPQAPKSSVKQIFGYTQPSVTYVQPTLVAVTPSVQVTDYNQSTNYQNTRYSTLNTGTTKTESTGYDYSRPNIKFEEGITYSTTPAPVTVTKLRPQSFSHTQQTLHGQTGNSVYSTATPVREEPFKRVVAYTTGTPVSYVQPTAQSYSQQTVHKIESNVYTPTVESGEKLFSTVTYETSTPQSINIVPSVESARFGQQTVHTVDTNKINTYSQAQSGYEYSQPSSVSYDQSSGYDYNKPSVQYEDQKTVQYSTPIRPNVQSYLASEPVRPIVTTAKTIYENPLLKYTVQVTPATYQQTYVPQAFSQQTINRGSAYQYKSTATPIISVQPTVSSYQTQVYNEQNSQGDNQEYGYDYSQPSVSFKESVSTGSPIIVSTDRPQVYSQQTIHGGSGRTNFGSSYEYKSTAQPTEPTSYQAQGYNEQANYEPGYKYSQPSVRIQEAGTVSTSEPIIVTTAGPQAYSHQTIHRGSSRTTLGSGSTYQAQAYDSNSQANYESGYEYSQPSLSFKESNTVSTVTPIVVSTEGPQSYSQQTLHRVEKQRIASTALPRVELTYQKPAVTVYENPILKYAQKVTLTDVRPAVYSQTVKEEVSQPIQYETGQQSYGTQSLQFNQGFSYDQPEIQRNVEISSAPAYSDASAVSHQVFHQSQTFGKIQQKGKDVVFVSTTPSTLIYEDHYSAYEAPKQRVSFNSEYIPSKSQEYYTVSTTSTPLQEQSGYRTGFNQYNIESDSQSTFEVPNKVESVHFSSVPSSISQFKQTRYESPEIQVAYNAEQYLPPVVSTSTPVVTSTYRPRIYSTTVTSPQDYLQPSSEKEYSALEFKPLVKDTSLPSRVEKVETLEYLPPTQKSASRVVNYETFGYNTDDSASSKNRYDFQQDYSTLTGESVSSTAAPKQRKQNLVIETAKSHLLGFGTVGSDAGLVSTYTTPQPSVSTENTYFVSNGASSTSSPEIVDVIPATRRTRPKYFRPAVKSTTERPIYVDSTTYQAPEYLPPSDDVQGNINSFGYNSESISQIKYNPYQSTIADNIETLPSTPSYTRKQNIVVETAKSNLLGFGAAGYDAGLGTYTTSASADISSTARATPVTSTYAPVRQELVEVTSTRVPLRRTRPKVAVVTKINDFNPLLVRKLGAVCSCQSPVLVLKGRRPTAQTQIIEDYSSVDSSNQENIDDGNWQQESIHVTTPISNTVTTAPIVSSTFNPIIVPDDSYYQDYEEARNDNIVINPSGRGHSEKYVSSTPAVSTTERVVRIRPRVNAVTVAPTYKTVILKGEEAEQESESADTVNVDSQTFDRYGPGGWRSRDETLQGSIDCQRAGLFRHPKQCNKFYACRWDCTKQRFTLHVFNCPVQLSFDPNIGACNWPSQGPACQGDTLLTNTL